MYMQVDQSARPYHVYSPCSAIIFGVSAIVELFMSIIGCCCSNSSRRRDYQFYNRGKYMHTDRPNLPVYVSADPAVYRQSNEIPVQNFNMPRVPVYQAQPTHVPVQLSSRKQAKLLRKQQQGGRHARVHDAAAPTIIQQQPPHYAPVNSRPTTVINQQTSHQPRMTSSGAAAHHPNAGNQRRAQIG